MVTKSKKQTGEVESKGTRLRAQIIQAAIDTFAEKGFEAASTRMIAGRAGIEQGHLTYHFSNKEALWRASVDQIFGSMGNHLETTMQSLDIEDARERTRRGIREVVHYLARHPELFRFLVNAGNRSDEMMCYLVDNHLKPRLDFMVEQGIASVRQIEIEYVAHAFFALSGAASFIFAVGPACKRLTGVDPGTRAAIDRHADFLADLMVP